MLLTNLFAKLRIYTFVDAKSKYYTYLNIKIRYNIINNTIDVVPEEISIVNMEHNKIINR